MTERPASPDRYRLDEIQFGRPTLYDEDVASEILDRLATGSSLKRICDKNDHLPGRNTVYQWLMRHSDFRDKYADAREIQADCVADNVLGVAEDVADGSLGAREGHVVFRASTWFAGVTAPHKYSERTQIQHTGPDGGPLEVHHIGQDERRQRIAELEAKRGPLIEGTAEVIG